MCVCESLCALVIVYLLSIGVAQHVASHYVDEVGLRVDFAHEAAEPLPESAGRRELRLHGPAFSPSFSLLSVRFIITTASRE